MPHVHFVALFCTRRFSFFKNMVWPRAGGDGGLLGNEEELIEDCATCAIVTPMIGSDFTLQSLLSKEARIFMS